MPPKGNGKEKAVSNAEEEILQAVILADSFDKRFQPLTLDSPRCLLPICNAPLLDWTLEALASAGVQDVFVICRSHAEMVKAAIRDSKWSLPGSGIKITPIVTAREAFSPGDALRDIYTHGIITTDFVLVHGDLVSNVRIDEAVRTHKERRRKNKDAIMTIVVMPSGPRHRSRPRGETSLFILDSDTRECLHYESVQGYPVKCLSKIPRSILKEHIGLEIRNDLVDCGIDICSIEVPSLFQDNFDYQDIRRDFVHGVLTSDLLMKNIHCHVVTDGYAARVKDTKSYASITKDILNRWTFPLVPDCNHPNSFADFSPPFSNPIAPSDSGSGQPHTMYNVAAMAKNEPGYTLGQAFKYFAKGPGPSLARSSKIGSHTLLGPASTVEDKAEVSGSVLGRYVRVGESSTVKNSYLWDGAIVEAGCHVENSIVGRNVVVKTGSKIAKGCLVGDGVVLGPHADLKPFTRVSKLRLKGGKKVMDDEDIDEDLEVVEAAQTPALRGCLGKESNGMVWPEVLAEESEDEEDRDERENLRLLRLGDNAFDLQLSDEGSVTEDTESEDEDEFDHHRHHANSSASTSNVSLPVLHDADAQAEMEFQAEVKASLTRAFLEGHSVDNAAVELKTLRMASNVPLRRVRQAVVAGIVEQIPLAPTAPQQRKEIARVVDRWGDLITKIGGVDAVDTISILQEYCARSPKLVLFGQLLAALYQTDIVDEDDIRAWHALPSSKDGSLKGTEAENFRKCWAVGTRMIQQFDDQDDSDSE